MKLHISRDQDRGLMGGIKFELRGRVQLTNEESELIRKYKVEKDVLLTKEVKIPLTNRAFHLKLTIGSLTAGQTIKCDDISEILEVEIILKDTCGKFKQYIEVMKSFGGEEIIEYN